MRKQQTRWQAVRLPTQSGAETLLQERLIRAFLKKNARFSYLLINLVVIFPPMRHQYSLSE